MRNKTFLAFGIALLSAAGNVMAQDVPKEEHTEKFYFGLKAGINRSNVWDEKGQDFKADARTGFAGGAFFSIPLIHYIGIQPEVLISQKGYQSSGTFLGNFYSNTRTTTYLDIPILFALKPSPMFTILLGPEYSYLMHQTDVTRFGANSTATEQQFQNENARKNIFGLIGGLDVNIKHVVISGRAGWDVSNNNGDGTSTTPRYKNQWLQFTVGFRI
jgi:hypothetical protein